MIAPLYGALAQLVERHNGIVEASGSRPLRSKNTIRLLRDRERLGVVLHG